MLHRNETLYGTVLADKHDLGRLAHIGPTLCSCACVARNGQHAENERHGDRAQGWLPKACRQNPRFRLARSSAARRPCASRPASSFAQKCMQKRCGESLIRCLCSAVTSMPCWGSVFRTGLTSLPSRTKSPVTAALPPPVG